MGDNELYSEISPIANEYKHFLALFVGVGFRSNSLWKMGDNALYHVYSRISPIANECRRFLVLFVGGLIWSVLRITACAMGDNELYSKITTQQK